MKTIFKKSLFQPELPQKSPTFHHFPQKPPFCQNSIRNLLLSVTIPSESSFFLSEFHQKPPSVCENSFRIIFFSVRILSEKSDFLSEMSIFESETSSFCQNSPRNVCLSINASIFHSETTLPQVWKGEGERERENSVEHWLWKTLDPTKRPDFCPGIISIHI